METRWSLKDLTGPFLTTSSDLRAATLASGQWSILDIDELYGCGFSYSEIKARVARGILHRLYRGVYAWGHPNVGVEGRWLAAVKACGQEAVLSHYSGAALREWVPWDGRPFDVTAPTKRSHPRIRAHRSERIERTLHKGIPVTPKLRTLIDLAATEDERTVRRALRQARLGDAELAQLPRHILDLGADPTRSPREDDALDVIAAAGLRKPAEVNAPYRLPGRTVYPDLRWPELRLIVEVDSRQFHEDPLARHEDAERQAELEAAGERVIRVTTRQLRRPARFIARLRAAGVPEWSEKDATGPFLTNRRDGLGSAA
jgi:hypothetical protein